MKTEVIQKPGDEAREERWGHVLQPDDLVPDLGHEGIGVEQSGFVFRIESDSEQPAK